MEQASYYQRLVGENLDGRYRIEKLLGVGGMSVVYKATDLENDRTVAVKMLKEEIAEDREALDRFINESKTVAMLSHPNIVGIYESRLDRPEKYLVMEYVEGISLRTYMDRRGGALDFDEVEGYAEQILAALEHAHNAGVVHRDIKPQNIMLLKNGIVKVADFGIAKMPGGETAALGENAIGTVFYISPEQAEGGLCDNRSDLYSLGVMMYEMATGKLPFYDSRAAAVLYMQMQDKPVPPREINKKIPRGLEQLILCAMEKDPRKRYQSALDMFRELRKLKAHKRASVLTPARIRAKKRSEKNREQNRPSRSVTPVILGVAFALLAVGIVSVFTALDRLKIGSLGTVSITVPDAFGQTYVAETDFPDSESYRKSLEAMGLGSDYVVSVEYRYSDDYPEGMIFGQSPTAGASRKSPCNITLTVSLGLETVTMEDYTVTEWRVAQSLLRSRGFGVRVIYEDNPVIAKGYVINSSPQPGEDVLKGSTVTLRVSNGVSVGQTRMPDFTGFSEVTVASRIRTYPFYLGTVTYTRSTLPAGTVLFQSPEKDSIVYAGSTYVDFVVSGGPDFALNYYPDVTGKPLFEARNALEKLGFSVDVRRVNSALEENTVISQSPSVGTQSATTKLVYLSVSAGSGYSEKVTMLDVVGDSADAAKLKIDYVLKAKTEISYEIVYRRDERAPGTVIGQSPAAGETVTLTGSVLKVTLQVSAGANYATTVTVPYLVGLTEEEAVALLTAADIVPDPVYLEDALHPAGTVTSQAYPEGTALFGLQGTVRCLFTVSTGAPETVPAETEDPGTQPPDAETSAEPGTDPSVPAQTELPETGPDTAPVTG